LYALTTLGDVSYRIVLNGTCEEANYESITGEEECEYAVRYGLGLSIKPVIEVPNTDRAAGCAYSSHRSNYIYTENSMGGAGSSDRDGGIYHICASTGAPPRVVCDTEDNDVTVAVLSGAFAASMVALLAMIYAHCIGYKAIGSLSNFGKFSANTEMSQTML
jgi:hypothetical protein